MIDLKLDLGCRTSKREGYTGVVIIPSDSVDLVNVFNRFPFPFESETASDVWMDNILEHLERFINVIEGIFRISKNHI